jgi:hypothetical protein
LPIQLLFQIPCEQIWIHKAVHVCADRHPVERSFQGVLTVAATANTEISFGAVCYANEINANQINHTAPVITDKPTPA